VRLILSGEGKTDIGQNVPTEAGWEFQPGPMAMIVYSLLKTKGISGETIRFVHESELSQFAKQGPTKLAGIRYGKGTAVFTRNAQVLGLLAKKDREESNQPVLAILFRDADSTHSSSRHEWQEKFDSIVRGFELVEFDAGVPMVPRPKSEAWLLCGLKQSPYVGCAELENAPGNDNSPKSLKRKLTELVGHEPTADEQAEWIKSGRINPTEVNMPSFIAFHNVLKSAIANASDK